jgi:hypothetical protein
MMLLNVERLWRTWRDLNAGLSKWDDVSEQGCLLRPRESWRRGVFVYEEEYAISTTKQDQETTPMSQS